MSVFDKGSPAALFAAVAGSAALKYAAGFLMPSKPQKHEYKVAGRVKEIWIYPFKSFKGIKVQNADCTKLGISWRGLVDRTFTVTTSNNVYLTMRQEPTMALIEPVLNGNRIMLMAPGMSPISIPICPEVTKESLSKATVKTDTIPSVDCGDEVAKWLCDYFKRDGLRLQFSPPSLEKRDCRKNKKAWQHPAQEGDITAFHDYCPYMILSEPSLSVLNEKLESPVTMQNFRANIIVDRCESFDEDNWSKVRIGEAQFRALDHCTRCVLVTVDPFTGLKDPNEEPLNTLKKFRKQDPYGDKPCFGFNNALDRPGSIKVDDVIFAMEK